MIRCCLLFLLAVQGMADDVTPGPTESTGMETTPSILELNTSQSVDLTTGPEEVEQTSPGTIETTTSRRRLRTTTTTIGVRSTIPVTSETGTTSTTSTTSAPVGTFSTESPLTAGTTGTSTVGSNESSITGTTSTAGASTTNSTTGTTAGTTTMNSTTETSSAGTTTMNSTTETSSAGTTPATGTVNSTTETPSSTTGTTAGTTINGTAGTSTSTIETTTTSSSNGTMTSAGTTSVTGTTPTAPGTTTGPTKSPLPPITGTTATGTTSTTTVPTTTRRSTTPTPAHMCSTTALCEDANSHCVNENSVNVCKCRKNYTMAPNGTCQPLTTLPATPSVPPTTQATNDVETSTPVQRRISLLMANLTTHERDDIVSITFTPPVSAVDWILKNDVTFRTCMAYVINSFNYSSLLDNEESPLEAVNVSPDQVSYVAPSPQMVEDGLLVSILVLDVQGVSDRFRSAQYLGSVSFRHRRDEIRNLLFFPEKLVRAAIISKQNYLETQLKQNVSLIGRGYEQLMTVERMASATLFERRLDVFVPLILIATLAFMALTLGFACLRAKTRSTWDPPAGVVYGKTTLLREDPVGSTSRNGASGCDLATDEQCREGEEHKHCIRITEDDVWVTAASQRPLKTQFEDTKL